MTRDFKMFINAYETRIQINPFVWLRPTNPRFLFCFSASKSCILLAYVWNMLLRPKIRRRTVVKKTCLTFKEFVIPRLHLIPGECVACFKAFCASVGIRGFVFFCEFTARRKLNAQSATFTMELYPSACSPATSAVDRNQSGYKYNSVPLTVVNIFTNNNIIMSKLCLNL